MKLNEKKMSCLTVKRERRRRRRRTELDMLHGTINSLIAQENGKLCSKDSRKKFLRPQPTNGINSYRFAIRLSYEMCSGIESVSPARVCVLNVKDQLMLNAMTERETEKSWMLCNWAKRLKLLRLWLWMAMGMLGKSFVGKVTNTAMKKKMDFSHSGKFLLPREISISGKVTFGDAQHARGR